MRGQVRQPLLRLSRQTQGAHKFLEAHRIHPMTASKLLQTLIRVLHAGGARDRLRAHNHLNGLCQNLPIGLQIGGNNVGGNIEALQTLNHIGNRQHRMPKRHANIALCRRIGQITLPTRGYQRGRQRIKDRIGEFKISFRILKADRIHLMRHRRRARCASHRNLAEETNRNITPHVGAQIMQHTVEMRHIRVQLRLPVMRFDLRGQRVPAKPQMLHKTPRNSLPVSPRSRGVMRRIGARCAVNLAQELGGSNMGNLALQTVRQHSHFLAQRGGGCGLAVRAREHRNIPSGLGEIQQNLYQIAGGGKPYILDRVLNTQGIREVINVFGGAPKMHERHQMPQPQRFEAATDIVLDGFHIVNSDRLNLGEFGDGIGVELGHDSA